MYDLDLSTSQFLQNIGIVNPPAEKYLIENGYINLASLAEIPPTEDDLISRCKFTLREKNLILSNLGLTKELISTSILPIKSDSSKKKKKHRSKSLMRRTIQPEDYLEYAKQQKDGGVHVLPSGKLLLVIKNLFYQCCLKYRAGTPIKQSSLWEKFHKSSESNSLIWQDRERPRPIKFLVLRLESEYINPKDRSFIESLGNYSRYDVMLLTHRNWGYLPEEEFVFT